MQHTRYERTRGFCHSRTATSVLSGASGNAQHPVAALAALACGAHVSRGQPSTPWDLSCSATAGRQFSALQATLRSFSLDALPCIYPYRTK